MTTPYNTKYAILSQLWTDYKSDKQFKDFFEYNDIGLPLAFMLDQKIVESTPIAQVYVEETFALFCEALTLDDEEEWDDLDMMLSVLDEEDDV
jgi:hypothetical protein